MSRATLLHGQLFAALEPTARIAAARKAAQLRLLFEPSDVAWRRPTRMAFIQPRVHGAALFDPTLLVRINLVTAEVSTAHDRSRGSDEKCAGSGRIPLVPRPQCYPRPLVSRTRHLRAGLQPPAHPHAEAQARPGDSPCFRSNERLPHHKETFNHETQHRDYH